LLAGLITTGLPVTTLLAGAIPSGKLVRTIDIRIDSLSEEIADERADRPPGHPPEKSADPFRFSHSLLF
jgi:hypothetical protein